MKFVHTSDWHLGRALKGHDLSQAQQDALDAVIDAAIERDVDALVIAGDIFDRAFPSVEDVRRLRSALTRVHAAGIQIICTAGNHDEGARLAAFANLLDAKVAVVGEYDQVGDAVVLRDAHGPVAFYPLPYLDPDVGRRALAQSVDELLGRSHEAVMSAAMERVRADLTQRRSMDPRTRAVVIAHAFVVKGEERPEESDSERNIAVGGIPYVPSAVFNGVDYVALGHIHGPRTIQETEPMIRYSGSILRYSISETKHEKSATIVDIGPDGTIELDFVPVPQPAGMIRLQGKLADLVSGTYEAHYDDFVEIKLTDKLIPDNHYAQLSQVFTRILSVSFERDDRNWLGDGSDQVTDLAEIPPIDLLRTFYSQRVGEDIDADMEGILTEVLEEALKIEGK